MGDIVAMAIDPARNLYGANLSGLYHVDKTTGKTDQLGGVTLLNPDPSNPAYIVGLAFTGGRLTPSMPTASASCEQSSSSFRSRAERVKALRSSIASM